ncbi:MAG: SRPBCC domain-containing protein [Sphingomonas bacterium]
MQVSRIIKAPRAKLYAACLDPDMLARWRAPDRMSGVVHSFEAHVGGTYRMSLIYKASKRGTGKTSSNTDSFTGRFVELVPDEKIVESIAFESDDPAYAGTMTLTPASRMSPAAPMSSSGSTACPPASAPKIMRPARDSRWPNWQRLSNSRSAQMIWE